MEDVLDTYSRPYDPRFPVICMDEQPVQLVKETKTPLPMRRGSPRRCDYEYERAGTACIFLFTEPLNGWRQVTIRERRTSVDWAQEMAAVLKKYSAAKKIILVCDNLNTHKLASFYEAFPPNIAREFARRIEIHFTPKHGSWLNISECELSVMTRQCMKYRTPSIKALKKKITIWQKQRNNRQTGVNWQFTTTKARVKLKSLYPQIVMS